MQVVNYSKLPYEDLLAAANAMAMGAQHPFILVDATDNSGKQFEEQVRMLRETVNH